jgi:hypothetical protein
MARKYIVALTAEGTELLGIVSAGASSRHAASRAARQLSCFPMKPGGRADLTARFDYEHRPPRYHESCHEPTPLLTEFQSRPLSAGVSRSVLTTR